MSPIYHQLKAAGAMFGEIMGYERPLWYNNAIFSESGEETSMFFNFIKLSRC